MTYIYNETIIGERIKEARGTMTKAALAEKCGVEQYQTITKWENGDSLPSLKKLLKLCEIFHCELGYLLGYHKEKTRARTDCCKETGLSEEAVHKLQQLQKTDNPFFQQYIDFYSKLIEDLGIVGMLAATPGTIRRLEKNGLTSLEENVFDNANQAVDFYKFRMQECLMRFIDNYFADMDIEYIDWEE